MLSKNTMTEVIESKDEIIERQANEILVLNEQLEAVKIELKQAKKEIKDLNYQINNLTSCIIDGPKNVKIKDSHEFIQMELERNELFQQLEEFKNNNKIENSELFIKLKKERDTYKNDYNELNLRIQELEKNNINENIKNGVKDNINIDDKIKLSVDEALSKQSQELNEDFDKRFNLYKEEQNIKFNDLNDNYIKLQNKMDKQSIPTPSNSNETKKEKNKNNKNNNNIEENLICSKCKKENKFLYNIGLYKGFCRSCKNNDLLNILIKNTIFFDKLDDKQKGYRTINNFVETLYYKLLYNNNIYTDAIKDGIDITNWKILIDYIKKYKEIDTIKIKNKILRSRSLILLFNEDKYKDIQDIIKGINFSFKTLYSLDEDQWLDYKIYLEQLLDNKLNEKNKNNDDITSIDNSNIKNVLKCKYDFCNNYKNCKCNIKICDNCDEEFITNKKYITECGDC